MKRFLPPTNQFFAWLQKHDVKGKFRFFELTKSVFQNRLIQHNTKNGAFLVPYDQWCFWKTLGPERYYLDEMQPFCDLINRELTSFDFFDLGADVGAVSSLVANNCPTIQRIYAFEPNPISFSVLQENAQLSKLPFKAENKAVSDFDGSAHLQFDSNCHSDHEGHIDTNKSGNTQVVKLDSYGRDKKLADHLVLKIDVEGQEKQTLEGAANTIKCASKVIILLEIHPDTLIRDKMSAEDLFSAAESLREFKWSVPLTNQTVDRNQPFFEQFEKQQYDVIGVST